MSKPVCLRRDFDAPGLRRLARNSKDANQARRLLALATVYAGGTRTQAAEMGGVGLQIVRDWVVRFNADGPAGRPRMISEPSRLTSSARSVRPNRAAPSGAGDQQLAEFHYDRALAERMGRDNAAGACPLVASGDPYR